MEVHQILPSLGYRDAVSNHAIEIKLFLSENGYTSKVFAKYIHPKVSEFAAGLSNYKGSPQNIVFYHFSLAGGDVTDYVKLLPDKKILIYHNITPSEFFDQYDKSLKSLCATGLEELRELNNIFSVAIGDSEYNRLCLEQQGFKNTIVVPIMKDFTSFHSKITIDDLTRSYDLDTTINVLFVGRVSPNKKFEDIIEIFYYYHHCINPNSKLYLVGALQIPGYASFLQKFIVKLGLSESVLFTGSVSDIELVKYYKMAHIFLCMSEHEGFCVPLLEAMYSKIPIIAFHSSGVPWTLGNSGILVKKKKFLEIAELINILVENKKIRDRIIQKQYESLHRFDKQEVGKKLIQIIENL